MEHRLLELVGKFQSQLGSAAEHALKTENQGAIAFLDVSPGPRRMFKARLDREIQSCSIGAGLPARYNFSKHFEYVFALALQRPPWTLEAVILTQLKSFWAVPRRRVTPVLHPARLFRKKPLREMSQSVCLPR